MFGETQRWKNRRVGLASTISDGLRSSEFDSFRTSRPSHGIHAALKKNVEAAVLKKMYWLKGMEELINAF